MMVLKDMYMKNHPAPFFLVLSLSPRLLAHTGHGGSGFVSGIGHPILGLDHLLAMLCVGLLAAKLGGKARGGIPLAFVAAMLAGAILGILGLSFPLVEFFIVLSVVVLGCSLIPLRASLPGISGAGVALFAFFHGNAHGTEMPELAQASAYAAGFLIATASLLASGVLLGLLVAPSNRASHLLRFAGAAIAGMGLHMWMG